MSVNAYKDDDPREEEDQQQQKELPRYVFASPWIARMVLVWLPIILVDLGIIVVMWYLFLSPAYLILNTYTRTECEIISNSRAMYIHNDPIDYYRDNLLVGYIDENGRMQNATGSACENYKETDVKCSEQYSNGTTFSCLYSSVLPNEIIVASFYPEIIHSTKQAVAVWCPIFLVVTILVMVITYFASEIPIYQRRTDITTPQHLREQVEDLKHIISESDQSYFLFLIQNSSQGDNESGKEVVKSYEQSNQKTGKEKICMGVWLLLWIGLEFVLVLGMSTMPKRNNVQGAIVCYVCGVAFFYLAWLCVLILLHYQIFRSVMITTNIRTLKWSGSWMFGYKKADLWHCELQLLFSTDPPK